MSRNSSGFLYQRRSRHRARWIAQVATAGEPNRGSAHCDPSAVPRASPSTRRSSPTTHPPTATSRSEAGSPCCAAAPRSPSPWPRTCADGTRDRRAAWSGPSCAPSPANGWLLLTGIALTVGVSAAATAATSYPRRASGWTPPSSASPASTSAKRCRPRRWSWNCGRTAASDTAAEHRCRAHHPTASSRWPVSSRAERPCHVFSASDAVN
jgi:hypothetical protein